MSAAGTGITRFLSYRVPGYREQSMNDLFHELPLCLRDICTIFIFRMKLLYILDHIHP